MEGYIALNASVGGIFHLNPEYSQWICECIWIGEWESESTHHWMTRTPRTERENPVVTQYDLLQGVGYSSSSVYVSLFLNNDDCDSFVPPFGFLDVMAPRQEQVDDEMVPVPIPVVVAEGLMIRILMWEGVEVEGYPNNGVHPDSEWNRVHLIYSNLPRIRGPRC